jgi:hypothetical protein
MTFDWVNFQNDITTIGSILGVVSFIILAMRFLRERPILHCELGESEHYQKDTDGNGALSISLNIDNVGERGTSIREVKLLKTRPTDYSSFHNEWKAPISVIHISPNSSIKSSFYIKIQKRVIEEKEIDFDILLIHTHGKVKLTGHSFSRASGK